MPTVKEIVHGLPGIFNALRAKGYNRAIQLTLTGPEGGQWWLEIKNQKCTVHPGSMDKADFILEVDGNDFVSYFTGKVHPMDLICTKKMKFSGSMTEGIAFSAIWNIPAAS